MPRRAKQRLGVLMTYPIPSPLFGPMPRCKKQRLGASEPTTHTLHHAWTCQAMSRRAHLNHLSQRQRLGVQESPLGVRPPHLLISTSNPPMPMRADPRLGVIPPKPH
ncbi:hypothetical protein PIB30_090602 [Stylosanthes scabra]|uniref:Uncharacterized protein n=1 Tax=Stylosanthes scabra TaxID=79078 RepID=A0ABU6SV13_9FABA|nr:hypothetical protein [Stylosanthes scabra]